MEAGSGRMEKPTNIAPNNSIGWSKYLTDLELYSFGQNQFLPEVYSTGCGSFAFSILVNLILEEKITSGIEINRYLETHGYKSHFFGIPWFSAQRAANGVIKYLKQKQLAFAFIPQYRSGMDLSWLIDNLFKGVPTIVEVSWGTTRQVIRDLLKKGPASSVGHYLVLAGFKPVEEKFVFLDPGNGGVSEYSKTELKKIWLDQPNVFVKRGSAITFNRVDAQHRYP